MEINYKKLETYKPEIKLQETGTTIGSIVRWQRKQKNMTLNEGADGICSISYLSKVENNLIEPSDQILSDLKKRFDIEDLINYDLERFEEQYRLIINNLFNYREIPSLIYKLYESNNNYKSKLILFSFFIYHNYLNRAKTIYKELESEINKFNHNEINLYYYLTSLMLYKEGRYFLSCKIVSLTNIVDKNDELSMLIDYEKIHLKLILGRHMQISPLFEDLEKRLIKHKNINRYNNLLRLKILFSVNEYELSHSIALIEENSYLNRKDKQLYRSILNLLHQENINTNMLENNLSDSIYWYIVGLLYYDKHENYEKIKELNKQQEKYKKNPICEKIEFFLTSKYTLDSESFIRYFRNITSNIEQNYNGYYILNILFENAASYFENKNYYKAANLVRKYGSEMLLNLKRIT